MTDKYIDPATKKEMFRINDCNQETFSEDFKKHKDKEDGVNNHNERDIESEPRKEC